MPPFIALSFCLVFIGFALWVDVRRKPTVSTGLWIPLIWLLIIGSKPVSLWLNPSEGGVAVAEGMSDGSPLDRAIYSILLFLGCFILARRKIAWSVIFTSNRLVVLLLVYIALSVLWTSDPYVAFKRYIKLVGMLVMLLIVVTEEEPLEALRTVLRRWSYVLIPISLMLIKYYPHLAVAYWPWSGEQMLVGVAETKNMFGQLLLFAGLSLVWTMATRLRKGDGPTSAMPLIIDGFVLVLTMDLLRRADSATSLVCFVLGVFVLYTVRMSFVRRRVGLWIVTAGIVVAATQLSVDVFEWLTTTLGRDPTLTNRTEIWRDLLALRESALVGAGFEGFWTPERWATIAQTYNINSAHNGYLEVFLSLGVIGLSLWTILIVIAYRRCRLLLERDFLYGRFALSLFFVVVIYNITESGFRGLSLVLFFFLIVAVDVRGSREAPSRESTEPLPFQWARAMSAIPADRQATPHLYLENYREGGNEMKRLKARLQGK